MEIKYDYEIILGTVDYIVDDILKTQNLTDNEALAKINKYKEMLLSVQ